MYSKEVQPAPVNPETSRLQAFLRGVGGILDIYPHIKVQQTAGDRIEARRQITDGERMASDWANVGGYMREVMPDEPPK